MVYMHQSTNKKHIHYIWHGITRGDEGLLEGMRDY